MVHKPDIGIIEYDSIHRFWLKGQFYGERTPDEWKSLFRELIEGRKLLNKKGQHYNISIFDENIPSDVEEKWRKNKENTSDCALILKSQRGFFGVADAKNYSLSGLKKPDIDKTYLDAALLGSKNMYIVCKSASKKNDFELVDKKDKDGNNISVIRYKKYTPPELIPDREACRTTIKNYLEGKKT